MTDKLSDVQRYMLYLTACALNGKAPDRQRTGEMNTASLYRLSKRHSMSAIIYMALDSAKALDTDSELKKLWCEDKDKAIRKSVLLDAELSQLGALLAENKIWYMPLKGSVLKRLYPKLGMREMADCDILFDEKHRETVRRIMQSRGYTCDSYGKGSHDVYFKPPVCNFEMHISLFRQSQRKAFVEYYKNVEERLIQDADSPYLRRFSDEDFYVYLIAHASKHFDVAGTGVRILMDVFVYNREKGDTLDRAYIKSVLTKLEIAEFEADLFSLSKALFENSEQIQDISLEEKQLSLLEFLFGSGTYGTMENIVNSRLEKLDKDSADTDGKIKRRYYLSRLFPENEWYKDNFPFAYKHRWAKPFVFIYRVFRGIFFRRKKLKSEISAVDKQLGAAAPQRCKHRSVESEE